MAQKASFFYLRVLQTTKQILWECMGSILIAVGIYNFAVQAEFPMTGFSGISIILYRLLNIPIGLSTILLNIPVAILCYRLLGRKFFVSSLRCMIISSIVVDKVMYGVNAGKMALIVTNCAEQICRKIDAVCQRGTTIIGVRADIRERKSRLSCVLAATRKCIRFRKSQKKWMHKLF